MGRSYCCTCPMACGSDGGARADADGVDASADPRVGLEEAASDPWAPVAT